MLLKIVTLPQGSTTMSFKTLGEQMKWLNQAFLIADRRTDLAVPLTLPVDSRAFTH